MVHLYRRICVLRARDRHEEAQALQAGEFSSAVTAAEAAISARGGDGELESADFETHLQAALTQEEERVANASVLAQLLAPMLSEMLQPAIKAMAAAVPVERPSNIVPATEIPAALSSQSSAPLSIADFIEGMLLQEKPATRRAS